MNAELLTAYSTLGTVVVIGASAIAALIQLRDMRAGNQLEAIMALEKDFREPEVQAALHYVQQQLAGKLEERTYREELSAIGYVDVAHHPELIACNWFARLGTVLKHGLIAEDTFMDLFGRLIRYYWRALKPVVALMRRSRGPGQYDEFEYLALRADAWLERHPHGLFPRGVRRATIEDPWLAIDVPPASTGSDSPEV